MYVNNNDNKAAICFCTVINLFCKYMNFIKNKEKPRKGTLTMVAIRNFWDS